MDEFQRDQLVVFFLDGTAEIERRVAFVDDLLVAPLQERAHLWLARQDGRDQLATDLLLVFRCDRSVPLLKA